MEPIRPRYTWRNYEGPRSLSRSPGRQAVSVELVCKSTGLFQREHEIFVRKVLPCGDGKRATYVQREYGILQSLKHRNIVGYEDCEYRPGQYNARLYLEYCPGGDLGQYLPPPCKLTRTQTLQIIQQISSALLYLQFGILITVNSDGSLHDPQLEDSRNNEDGSGGWKAIIHRDIKPQNSNISPQPCLLYTPDIIVFIFSFINGYLHVKLGDFGLAKPLAEDTSRSYVGTQDYIAPVSCSCS
jgi:serine/threonine protein kinase